MKLSRKGAMFILAHEAIVREAYRDGGGVLTIGVGHTSAAGEPHVRPGMFVTLERAIEIFRNDVAKFERRVLQAVKRPLKQHEFDALVSFDFNTGAISSGSVDDKLNRGDVAGALDTLVAYRKDNGKVIDGLVKRRQQERAMFEWGEYFERAIALYDSYPGKAVMLDPSRVPWPDDAPPVAPIPDRTDPQTGDTPRVGKPGGNPLGWLVFAILAAAAAYFGFTLEIPQ